MSPNESLHGFILQTAVETCNFFHNEKNIFVIKQTTYGQVKDFSCD